MANREYFLGLDIGTESVGWAVTDQNYRLMECTEKTLWGVRLFDEANTAVERRGFRTARRRTDRRKRRLLWLQEQFSQEIAKADSAFFQRLKESKFSEDEKQGSAHIGKYTLFCDTSYNDINYNHDYPTIYHLRKALIESDRKYDIRLIYLAVHHIMKNRGHFLFGGLAMDSITLEAGIERLNSYLSDELELQLTIDDLRRFSEILTGKKYSVMQKRRLLAECCTAAADNETLNAVIDLLAGKKVKLNKLYGDQAEAEDIGSFSLRDDFDNAEEKLTAALGDKLELILAAKQIYDWALLEELRGGERFLSFAKVNSYEKHRKDLGRLKKAIRENGSSDLYREIFHTAKDKLNNYVAYSGKGATGYTCTYDLFSVYLKQTLKKLPESEEIQAILAEIDAESFLPKQTVKDNGVIPHQLHLAELKAILENAAKHYSFLSEIDESGLTKKQQIIDMFTFRIPYYVGPLNEASPHAWIVRGKDKIYPWNFEQVVDLEKCAENFITRMTAKCSYVGMDVLPKDSLLYSKFTVLNELNNLKINGRPISVDLKQSIYIALFSEGKKVSEKKLRGFLEASGKLQPGDTISGIDGDFKSTLASWQAFSWLTQREGGADAAEEIVRHIVLFGDDKKLLTSWLTKTYGSLLTAQEINKCANMKFSGWGRLSKKFLTEILHIDRETTGEAISIIDALWCTNDNLMQLLSSRYNFEQAIQKYRDENLSNEHTLDSFLNSSYASPSIRRAIRQTITIISEIEKIMGGAPKRVFVEVAREHQDNGKRTESRKAKLLQLYKNCGEQSNELYEQIESRSEGELRRDKLYLYYTQLGKCMYSGQNIDLKQIDTDYDIEHIYPQSKIKDDSLTNRVLVNRVLNSRKSDTFPISADIRTKMRPFWAQLKSKGLITTEKYERLTRATPFGNDELSGFVARQLVETRQSSKIIAELLKNRYGDNTDVVYVKAGNVSSFRQDQRIDEQGLQKQASQCKNKNTVQDPVFVKCREVNDLHHAKDAYLNIAVGNVYHLKFTKNFFKKDIPTYSLNRMFDFDVTNGTETAWQSGASGTIQTVRNTMRKNNILVTRMPYNAKGGFYDQTIMPKGKGQAPLKSSDLRMTIENYGGYNKVAGCCFCLVEHTEKKKRVRSLESVTLLYRSLYEASPEEYCRSILRLDDPRILIREIKINSLVEFDGFRMNISGRTGSQIIFKNANQLIISPERQKYIKDLSKYLERCKAAKCDLKITRFDGITGEQNDLLYGILLEKLQNKTYSVKYETAAKTVSEQYEKFKTLSLPDSCRIIMQLLNLFSNTAASADLKLLCGKAGIGILLMSKNLSNYKEHSLLLINQSPTGVFESKADLLNGVF